MSILVVAEHDNTEIKGATLSTVAAAQAIGGDIAVLVAGEGCSAAGEAAAKIDGVAKVLVADNAAYGHQLAENLGDLVAELGKDTATSLRLPPLPAKTSCRVLRRCWMYRRSPRSCQWKVLIPSNAPSTQAT